MIYLDHLGQPDPEATISVFGASYGAPNTGGYFSLSSTAKNRLHKKWDYVSKDVSHIVAEIKNDGWECVVTKDGYNAPVIKCTHTETQAALDELTSRKVKLIGEGEAGYIRFGDVPESGRSINKVTGEVEPGVSVYRATFFENGYNVETPWYSQGTYISVSQRRPIYRVWGEFLGDGSDGEPCVKVTRKEQLQ